MDKTYDNKQMEHEQNQVFTGKVHITQKWKVY